MGLIKDGSRLRGDAAWRGWVLPICITLAAVIVALGGDDGREYLRYDRSAISDGQLWRLVSGHIVHLGLSHLLLNLAGLLLVWYLVGSCLTAPQWALVLAVSLAGIDAGFWWLEPQLSWYVGLSGALHGLLAAGIVRSIGAGRTEPRILAAALILKLAYEQFYGPLPGSETSSGGDVVVAAHLYGALAGALTGAAILIRVHARPSI
jgi:rhomboid family GlyGly-CTERM serine protease